MGSRPSLRPPPDLAPLLRLMLLQRGARLKQLDGLLSTTLADVAGHWHEMPPAATRAQQHRLLEASVNRALRGGQPLIGRRRRRPPDPFWRLLETDAPALVAEVLAGPRRPLDAEVLQRFHLRGQTVPEIAQALGLTERDVAARFVSARERLGLITQERLAGVRAEPAALRPSADQPAPERLLPDRDLLPERYVLARFDAADRAAYEQELLACPSEVRAVELAWALHRGLQARDDRQRGRGFSAPCRVAAGLLLVLAGLAGARWLVSDESAAGPELAVQRPLTYAGRLVLEGFRQDQAPVRVPMDQALLLQVVVGAREFDHYQVALMTAAGHRLFTDSVRRLDEDFSFYLDPGALLQHPGDYELLVYAGTLADPLLRFQLQAI